MHALYQNFRKELRTLRRIIEDPNWKITDLNNYLDSNDFYKQVIRYRIEEVFHDAEPTKKELLRLLSLWEMDL